MSWSTASCSGTEPPASLALQRAERWADALSLVCFGLLSLLMLLTVRDYGLTYDEQPHIRLGERVLDFYLGGFQASSGLTRSVYGAGFDLIAALLRRVSPWDEFRTNHVLCVFVAQLGLLGTWKLGRLLGGPIAGLLALLFLVATPVYYGHQFNNPKDIPFASGYVWGLYAIARLVTCCVPPAVPRPFWRALAARWPEGFTLALVLGLGMSVRNAGAIMIAYLFALVAARVLDAWRLKQYSLLGELGRVAVLSAVSSVLSWGVMLLFWPGALASPLERPAEAFEKLSRYTTYDSPTLLRGQSISSNRVPWDYLPSYFAVQLPEWTTLCWLACVLGLVVHTASALWRRRPIAWSAWLLVAAVLLPPVYAIVKGSTLYNGLRHFLFLMPAISALAALGLGAVLRSALLRRPRWALLPAGLMLLFCADQAHALWRLHPHQHVFFNRASGGLQAAVERYETEYYGSVYQELHEQLRERIWSERREGYLNRTWLVAGCGSKLFFARNLPLNFQYLAMRDARAADFYATYIRDGCLRRFRDRAVIGQVTRDGANLALARDMKLKKGTRRAKGGSP